MAGHLRPDSKIPAADFRAPANRIGPAFIPSTYISRSPSPPRTVRFAVPPVSSAQSASTESESAYDSASDAPSEQTVLADDGFEDRDAEPETPVLETTVAGTDPRFGELRPCVACRARHLRCDGVPCTLCDQAQEGTGEECTPTREVFLYELARVTLYLTKRIPELERLRSSLSPHQFLRLIGEEMSNDLYRFNFRVHNEKTQLVVYARRCYYCHPRKRECIKGIGEKRCRACARENRVCKRFAITFTNSDNRLGSIDQLFRTLYNQLLQLKADAKHASKSHANEVDDNPPVRGSTFATSPPVSLNQEASPLPTFPWMAIFDTAITQTQANGVKDLTQFTKIPDRMKCNSGGFADVYTGTLTIKLESHSLGLEVAIKCLRKNKAEVARIDYRREREMTIWSKLRHPNILPFLGFSEVEELGPCLVSPWMVKGDVLSYIQKTENADKMRLIRGIIQGLAYMHTQNPPVAHLDIKGANILVSDNGTPVLCDFGLAVLLDPDGAAGTTTSAQHGSSRYMAPERMQAQKFNMTQKEARSLAADMFSFAMTVIEILSGDVPFGSKVASLNAALKIMDGERPEIPQMYLDDRRYDNLVNAIRTCWATKREERMKAEEVLEILA